MTRTGFIIFSLLVTFALATAAYICYLTYQEDMQAEQQVEEQQ